MRTGRLPRAVSPLRCRRLSIALWCVGAAIAGCAAPQHNSAIATPRPVVPPAAGAPEIKSATLPDLGPVLVDGRGFTLYMFEPDNRRVVACTDACAGSWPPLKLPDGTQAQAGPGVSKALLGSLPNSEGGRVVTYAGWPLYGYASDLEPGQANGQALDLNGGPWYVLRPTGEPVVPPEPAMSDTAMEAAGG